MSEKAIENDSRGQQYWVIKTTEGGPRERDLWPEFKKEKVVAVGWRELKKADPTRFNSRQEFAEHVVKNYNTRRRKYGYAARTIYKFARAWQAGDRVIICSGYPPKSQKPVRLHGIAQIGGFFCDQRSKWWTFKRNAEIRIIEEDISVKIFRKIFLGSMLKTIPGPFSRDQFRKFNAQINAHITAENFQLPEELSDNERLGLLEGNMRQIMVNAYERNPEARKKCIQKYGTDCFVCKFSFAKTYGEHGDGFIHVHHLRPLAKIGKKYEVDPIKDLRPVCPNCHAIIHRGNQAYSIQEMKRILSRHSRHRKGEQDL